MPRRPTELLNDGTVVRALAAAWRDSAPGPAGGHEEGGFILGAADGKVIVVRWPVGEQDTILVPPHSGCSSGHMDIIASFHTHPNTGPEYLQEPSETDKRGVRDDADLKGPEYVGEFVITNEFIYIVTPAGNVRELGPRAGLLNE